MSWKEILKDVKSELKEMFNDEKVIERYDAVGDAEKEMVESLMFVPSKFPDRDKRVRQAIYAVLGLDSYKEYPETKSAPDYLEEKDKEFLALDSLYEEYQEKGRKILEKIWDENPFDENSREFRDLEGMLDREYEAHGIKPQY
tara:strand:+ start:7368 stop:7796 length:429 start_codon:yes stop_codon:yes gene_type:complete